jgi:hypothetical protein
MGQAQLTCLQDPQSTGLNCEHPLVCFRWCEKSLNPAMVLQICDVDQLNLDLDMLILNVVEPTYSTSLGKKG